MIANYSAWQSFVNRMDRVTPLKNLQHDFATRLKQMGYTVKEIPDPLNYPSTTDWGTADLTETARKENVNVLLVIGNLHFGATNSKLYSPQWYGAHCLWGFMSEMTKGQVLKETFNGGLWKAYTTDQTCLIPLPDGWENPTHFDEDQQILNQSLQQSENYLLEQFFQTAPPVKATTN